MKKMTLSVLLGIALIYACSFPIGNQKNGDTGDIPEDNPNIVRTIKTSGWASEAERVINAARQHAGQRPYGDSDGGWKKNSYDSSGNPIGEQLMYADSPYLPKGWVSGLDCVGLVHVVFTETGHASGSGKIVAGRQEVPTMYTYYREHSGKWTYDNKLVNKPTDYINDTNTQIGDIIILRAPDFDPGTKTYHAPTSAPKDYCKHVGIYSGDGYMIHMTSNDMEETKVNLSQGYDKDNKIYYRYYIAAVVHTNLTGDPPKEQTLPPPPLDLSHIWFDVTGYFTSNRGIMGLYYHPILPIRVMDSRKNNNATVFNASRIQTIQVAHGLNVDGLPIDAAAVTGNLTIVKPSAAGFVSVLAGGLLKSRDPAPATIIFEAGETRANGLTVKVNYGKMDVEYFSSTGSGTVDIIFDVTGYYSADPGSTYIPLNTFRALDSRRTSSFTSGQAQTFPLVSWFTANGMNYPANVTAVTGNLTVTRQTAAGFVSIAPGGTLAGGATTSTINFPKGVNIANGVTVTPQNGKLDIIYVSSSGTGQCDVIFDITGYFVYGDSGSTYIPFVTLRALDTYSKGNDAALKSRSGLSFDLGKGIYDQIQYSPLNMTAVTGNVSILKPMNYGYLAVCPGGTPLDVLPTTSTLNFTARSLRSNNVTTMVVNNRIVFQYVATPSLVVR
jgi:cell wall-associated NlpC family hydrolase